MRTNKWIKDKLPLSNGKYWVYPYITVDGYKMVTILKFENGKWDKKQSPNFWQPIEIPKPPPKRML